MATKDRRLSINDVARRAGVSPTTVSHSLSGKRPVAIDTKDRILAVVAEMGFRPSEVARSLRTSRTNTVGLLIPDITNPFYPEMARGVQDVLATDDKFVLLCSTDGRVERELDYLDKLIARGVDGVIVVSFALDSSALQAAADAGVAVVRLDDVEEDVVDSVSTDQRTGTLRATQYLIDQGRGRIGFIGGPHGLNGIVGRQRGYEDALRGSGRKVNADHVVTVQQFTRKCGVDGARRLLTLPDRPDALVCANDLIAIGALDVAREMGLRVPEDVAVIGYDDIEAASLVSPPLTTITNRPYELGTAAGELVLSRLTGDYDGPPRKIVLPTPPLVLRSSA